MQLHTIKSRTKRITSQQVGRGGTRGKTSGRGTKGQNARAGRKKRPELRDFIKRFPKLRGRGVSSFKSYAIKPLVVNLSALESHFTAGDMVNKESILKHGILNPNRGTSLKIKVLAKGTLTKKLSFEGLIVSETARKAIESVGGDIK